VEGVESKVKGAPLPASPENLLGTVLSIEKRPREKKCKAFSEGGGEGVRNFLEDN